jgi:hypothetical protein
MEGFHDEGVSIHHEKYCVRSGYETRREVNSDFQVDLQDQACCIWQHRDVQSLICGSRILPARGIIL